jgi:hypothetical protein
LQTSLWITEHPEGQRYGKELWLVQKEQWAEEVIPSPVEAEDGTGDHCGLDQREKEMSELDKIV